MNLFKVLKGLKNDELSYGNFIVSECNGDYEVYLLSQAEESDPNPKLVSKDIWEIINYILLFDWPNDNGINQVKDKVLNVLCNFNYIRINERTMESMLRVIVTLELISAELKDEVQDYNKAQD